jgi:hypothetical protein
MATSDRGFDQMPGLERPQGRVVIPLPTSLADSMLHWQPVFLHPDGRS